MDGRPTVEAGARLAALEAVAGTRGANLLHAGPRVGLRREVADVERAWSKMLVRPVMPGSLPVGAQEAATPLRSSAWSSNSVALTAVLAGTVPAENRCVAVALTGAYLDRAAFAAAVA